MENAYTNIHCISPDLPVVKFGKNSIACLTDNSGDESKCFKYSDFDVPSDYQCTNSKKSLNNFLSKDGLRNKGSARSLFDKLMKDGYHNIECNKASFEDPNHWCGQVKQAIDQRCNSKSEAERITDRVCDKNLLTYSQTHHPSGTSKTVSSRFSNDSFKSRASKCIQNCARQRRFTPEQREECNSNCNLCGNTICQS
jgi:hypothetical protein